MDELEESLLPGILRDIAGLIGLAGALTLLKHYGGVRLYVPRNFDPDHALVKVLGPAATLKLIEHCGGEDHFDIPKAQGAVNALRNATIREQYGELSQRQLALKYDLTERHIRNILAGGDEDDGQTELF